MYKIIINLKYDDTKTIGENEEVAKTIWNDLNNITNDDLRGELSIDGFHDAINTLRGVNAESIKLYSEVDG